MSARRDWAVVLARGASARMGRPKGLCRPAAGGPPFIASVADLYAAAGLPLAVVTTPELRALYGPALAEGPPARWVVRGPGADTAASVAAALEELGEAATHLWLHPVDLPAVDVRTVARLAWASRGRPEAVVVPACAGAPGHPVVLPCAPFASLRGSAPPGPMRDVLRARQRGEGGPPVPLITLEVDDPGVVADHDEPGAEVAAPAPGDGEVEA